MKNNTIKKSIKYSLLFIIIFTYSSCSPLIRTYVPAEGSITMSKKEAVSKVRAHIIASFQNVFCPNGLQYTPKIYKFQIDAKKIEILYRGCSYTYDKLEGNFNEITYFYHDRSGGSDRIILRSNNVHDYLILIFDTQTEAIQLQEALYVLGAQPIN